VKVANSLLESMKKSKDIKNRPKYFVLKSKISKPEKVGDKEKDKSDKTEAKIDVYKIFIDVEAAVKDKGNLFDFCFDYMPFMIEVIEPMNVVFPVSDLNDYLANIQVTLHKIDEELKKAKLINEDFASKYQNVTKSLVRLLRNNILLSLKEKSKTVEDISKNVGVPEEQLNPFLEGMVNDKEIKKSGDKYSLSK